jgi:hypothetical protein
MSEYKSPYAANIGKMYNAEVVSLAKNRFTDEETQIAIAKHYYPLGRQYLAENPDVSPKAAQILWERKGYVLKCSLLMNGKMELSDEEMVQFYRTTFKGRERRKWRMQQAFLGGYTWYRQENKSRTPGSLLEEMYADTINDDPESYFVRRFVEHPNCTLNLALRISTMKIPEHQIRYGQQRWNEIKQAALMKVAEITKREGATSR